MAMTLTTIKEALNGKIGMNIQVTSQTGRKRQSIRRGKLTEVYPSLFVVELDQEENKFERVSYSYSDVLTRSVEILFDDEVTNDDLMVQEA